MSTKISLATLNRLPHSAFVAELANVFEHSPWIAEGVAGARPFASADQLHAAMCTVVARATVDAQLGLLRAHPELAGREARAGRLTAASSAEQGSAGLHNLSAEEMARVQYLNKAYRERFGFPFIIAVRENTKDAIFAQWVERLQHDTVAEFATALEQVGSIARLRLQMRLGE